METNYPAVVAGTLAVLPGMRTRRRGAIVNVSSDTARAPTPGEAGFARHRRRPSVPSPKRCRSRSRGRRRLPPHPVSGLGADRDDPVRHRRGAHSRPAWCAAPQNRSPVSSSPGSGKRQELKLRLPPPGWPESRRSLAPSSVRVPGEVSERRCALSPSSVVGNGGVRVSRRPVRLSGPSPGAFGGPALWSWWRSTWWSA